MAQGVKSIWVRLEQLQVRNGRAYPFEIDNRHIAFTPANRPEIDCKLQYQESADEMERQKDYRETAKNNLAEAIAEQKFYADKYRSRGA